jgi:hypothetical protein
MRNAMREDWQGLANQLHKRLKITALRLRQAQWHGACYYISMEVPSTGPI